MTVQFMVPGKPLYSLTCAWSSRYNPVTEVEGPGADGDTDVILYMSLLHYAVAAVMIAHFQMLYMLLLHNTVTVAVYCCCYTLLLYMLLLHVTAGQTQSIHYACTWRHSCTRRNQHGLLLLVFATQACRTYLMPAG